MGKRLIIKLIDDKGEILPYTPIHIKSFSKQIDGVSNSKGLAIFLMVPNGQYEVLAFFDVEKERTSNLRNDSEINVDSKGDDTPNNADLTVILKHGVIVDTQLPPKLNFKMLFGGPGLYEAKDPNNDDVIGQVLVY